MKMDKEAFDVLIYELLWVIRKLVKRVYRKEDVVIELTITFWLDKIAHYDFKYRLGEEE